MKTSGKASKIERARPKKGSLAASPQAKRETQLLIRTITGHVTGIAKMIDEERYCIDILKQITAIQALLSKLGYVLSESHMKHCVRKSTLVGEQQAEEKIDELMETLKYLRNL
jgi:DNA-binding FrmR family transcriptional regulator